MLCPCLFLLDVEKLFFRTQEKLWWDDRLQYFRNCIIMIHGRAGLFWSSLSQRLWCADGFAQWLHSWHEYGPSDFKFMPLKSFHPKYFEWFYNYKCTTWCQIIYTSQDFDSTKTIQLCTKSQNLVYMRRINIFESRSNIYGRGLKIED